MHRIRPTQAYTFLELHQIWEKKPCPISIFCGFARSRLGYKEITIGQKNRFISLIHLYPSQESEWSCMCVLGYRFWYLILELFDFVFHFISYAITNDLNHMLFSENILSDHLYALIQLRVKRIYIASSQTNRYRFAIFVCYV